MKKVFDRLYPNLSANQPMRSQSDASCSVTDGNEKGAELKILQHLENKYMHLNCRLQLECTCSVSDNKLRYTWLKDGQQIKLDQRITLASNKTWFAVNISCANEDDTGIYTFLAYSEENMTSSYATIFVAPENGTGSLYTMPISSPKKIEMLPTHVVVGQEIRLRVKVDTPGYKSKWYKSNDPIQESTRIKFLQDDHGFTLFIQHAVLNDTGIYFGIFYGESEVVTAVTNVYVLDIENFAYHSSQIRPAMRQQLPPEVTFCEGDRRAIMCKAHIDQSTQITWMKDETPINFTKSALKPVIAYNGHLALSFENATREDEGAYGIELKTANTRKVHTTRCMVHITRELDNQEKEAPALLRCLQSVIACVGSRVTFSCQYMLDVQHTYYYVVWYVGFRRIERSDAIFSVVPHQGEYLLAIKYVDPTMSGQVHCDLRRSTGPNESILVCRQSAQLTIVPSHVLKSHLLSTEIASRVFAESPQPLFTSLLNSGQQALNDTDNFLLHLRSDAPATSESRSEFFSAELTYCRLVDDPIIHFMEVKNNGMELSQPWATTIIDEGDNEKNIILEWKTSAVVKGYQVALQLPHGVSYAARTMSSPRFTLKNSVVETIYKFKISETDETPANKSMEFTMLPREKATKRKVTVKVVEELPLSVKEHGELLGSGAHGVVMLISGPDGIKYASKIIKTVQPRYLQLAQRECHMLQEMDHEKVVMLYDAMKAPTSFCLVMEYLWGGDLVSRLMEGDKLCEADVIIYVRQIAEGLSYMHSQNTAHFDIKPANIVCSDPNSKLLKIVDFGLARGVEKRSKVKCVYGTLDYVAPEMLMYDHKSIACDMWSLGVLTYVLLSGDLPFKSDSSTDRRRQNILNRPLEFNDVFDSVSLLSRDFIERLLERNVKKRMTVQEALNHDWLVCGPAEKNSLRLRTARANMEEFLLTEENKTKQETKSIEEEK